MSDRALPIGREAEIRALVAPFAPKARVRALVGPPASGKSHLLDEAHVRCLLAHAHEEVTTDDEARIVRFPQASIATVERLRAALLGEAKGRWFVDDWHLAPRAIRDAVERLATSGEAGPTMVVAGPVAPRGAEVIALGPLDDAAMNALAARFATEEPASWEALVAQAQGRPGWLLAALGRVPLSAEAVHERLDAIGGAASTGPARALFLLARAGGSLPLGLYAPLVREGDLRVLVGAALVRIHANAVSLVSPALAEGLAVGLSEPGALHELTATLLASPLATALPCWSVARVLAVGHERTALLRRAIDLAGRVGDDEVEIAAGLALFEDDGERDPALLGRLERKTRDASAPLRARVLAALDRGALADARLGPLARRRRADEAAKAGETIRAEALAAEATAIARELGDAREEALSLAMQGAVALLAADWIAADTHLGAAEACLGTHDADDPEERARLSHNRGAVALFKDEIPAAVAAFEDALARKRALHDRAGARASLSNLALAETRRGDFVRADKLLDEASELARVLGQTTGLAWCLGARAQAALARGRFVEATEHADEALAIEGVPAGLRADLVLHRAEALVAVGCGDAARVALADVDSALRASDTWLDARTWLVTARASLAGDRDERALAQRCSIAAIRAARRGHHADLEVEATTLLRDTRASRVSRVTGAWSRDDDRALDELLATIARGEPTEHVVRALLLPLLVAFGAERAFFVREAGTTVAVAGLDRDGLPLGDAAARLDAPFANALRAHPDHPAAARIEGRGGESGARLGLAVATARGSVALVLEHRFSAALLALGSADAPAGTGFPRALVARLRRWCLAAAMVNRVVDVAESLASDRVVKVKGPDEAPAVVSHEPERGTDLAATVLPRRTHGASLFPEILGASPAFLRAKEALASAVASDLPLLIVGETGTGKELFAAAVHAHGRRSSAPFVAVSCAAIPDALFEGELFGHARGSFTGADRARPGLLARANGGVLFLDEIGELPLARQATLLRALETRRFRPVGSDDERAFDVRLVAATNRDLDQAVANGGFRADLLYRLRVLSLSLPPLRDRHGDVGPLFAHYAASLGSSGATRLTLAPAALALLEAYSFPGNVRELRHLVERLAAAGISRVEPAHLPRAVRAVGALVPATSAVSGSPGPTTGSSTDDESRATTLRALVAAEHNITHAARALGLTRHGLKKRMKRLGLPSPHKDDES